MTPIPLPAMILSLGRDTVADIISVDAPGAAFCLISIFWIVVLSTTAKLRSVDRSPPPDSPVPAVSVRVVPTTLVAAAGDTLSAILVVAALSIALNGPVVVGDPPSALNVVISRISMVVSCVRLVPPTLIRL